MNKIQKLLYNQPEIRLSDDIIDRIIVTLRQKQRQRHLFKAIRNNILTANKDNPGICQNYDVTLKKVISKALVERWTNKEIKRMIDNIKDKYI